MAQNPSHAIPQVVTDALTAHGAAVEQVAVFIDGLKGTIATRMSDEDVATLVSGLDAASTRLRELTVDPTVPPPPEPPAFAPKRRK